MEREGLSLSEIRAYVDMCNAHKAEQRPGASFHTSVKFITAMQHSPSGRRSKAQFPSSLYTAYIKDTKHFQKYVLHFSNITTYQRKIPLFPYNTSIEMAIKMKYFWLLSSVKSKQVFTKVSTILTRRRSHRQTHMQVAVY